MNPESNARPSSAPTDGQTPTQAVIALSLLAAFADGDKHDRERAEIKRIAEGLSRADGVHLPTLVQDVLMKRITVATVAETLTRDREGDDMRQLAYEMAVCVCDADGMQSPLEQRFLDDVRGALRLDQAAAQRIEQSAHSMADAPLAEPAGSQTMTAEQTSPVAIALPAVSGAAAAELTPVSGPITRSGDESAKAPPAMPAAAKVDETVIDQAILNASITNGALELLPESLSTMAIIPLQMRLVYKIGQSYGYELDRGHIKDFLATVGVGLTSQYLEQAGRKLLGGLLGKVGGGLLGGVGRQAVSSGMSFAATYALGHVAKRYYAGGRTLSTDMLKQAYASITQEAQGLQSRYLPTMQEKARTLDAGKVMAMVRGR